MPDEKLPPPPALAPGKTLEPGAAITDDGARRDGGRTTEDKPVSPEKIHELAHTAIDHTREESGS